MEVDMRLTENSSVHLLLVTLEHRDDLVDYATKQRHLLLLSFASSNELLVKAGVGGLVTAGVVAAARAMVHGREISRGALGGSLGASLQATLAMI